MLQCKLKYNGVKYKLMQNCPKKSCPVNLLRFLPSFFVQYIGHVFLEVDTVQTVPL